MPRRTTEVTIPDEGRDQGKIFIITEMPARKAEKWANRALVLLSKGAGATIAREIDENSGWAGVAAVGLGAIGSLDWKDAEPLLDEMLECVQIRTGPSVVRPLVADDDVEEIATLVRLRKAALELHAGFSLADVLSKLRSLLPASAGSQNTETSPARSAR